MLEFLFPKGSLGIEITTHYIRFVQLKERGGLMSLSNFGRVSIPSGVFEDSVLVKPDILVSLVQTIIKESGEQKIRLTLPGESQNFFYLEIPKTHQKELYSEIVFNLKERIYFNEGRDEIVDIRTLGETEDSLSLRVVSAEIKWLETFKPLFKALKNYSYHIERANVAGLFGYSLDDSSGSHLHIQFGDDTSSLSIVENNKVVMYQEIPFSSYRFLLECQKKLTQPSGLASTYLSTLGIQGADVASFASEVLSPLTIVIDHAITDYAQKTGKHIHQVFLGGAFGGYKGVAEEISKRVRLPVLCAFPWYPLRGNFDESVYHMKKNESLEYLVALGLARDNG